MSKESYNEGTICWTQFKKDLLSIIASREDAGIKLITPGVKDATELNLLNERHGKIFEETLLLTERAVAVSRLQLKVEQDTRITKARIAKLERVEAYKPTLAENFLEEEII